MPNNRNPSLKIIDMKSDYIQFELSDTDISVANALRRIMIAEVPTLAIDLVHFENNTTVLLDEIIAHRLGLIPILSENKDMSEWNYGHECDCEDYCNKCSVRFSLDCDFKDMVKDKDTHEQDLAVPVTSRDLISKDTDVKAVRFCNEEEEATSHDEGIVIALLGPGVWKEGRKEGRKEGGMIEGGGTRRGERWGLVVIYVVIFSLCLHESFVVVVVVALLRRNSFPLFVVIHALTHSYSQSFFLSSLTFSRLDTTPLHLFSISFCRVLFCFVLFYSLSRYCYCTNIHHTIQYNIIQSPQAST